MSRQWDYLISDLGLAEHLHLYLTRGLSRKGNITKDQIIWGHSYLRILEQLNSCGKPPSSEDIWKEEPELKFMKFGADWEKLEPLWQLLYSEQIIR